MRNLVYLVAVERPRSKLHLAALFVEWEVLDVDGTGTLVDGRRNPEDVSIAVDYDVRLVRHFVLPVSAAYNTIQHSFIAIGVRPLRG